MKYLSRTVIFFLLLVSHQMVIAESTHIAKVSNKNAKTPITVSSDSKEIKAFLANYKADKLKGNRQTNIDKLNVSARQNQKSVVTKKEKIEKPIVIDLKSPIVQPSVVNKTNKFIFRDITARGEANVQLTNIVERSKIIDSLRHIAVTR